MSNSDVKKAMSEASVTMAEAADMLQKMREQSEKEIPILRQHQIMIDVLFDFQRSRWPWVRWVAKRMQEEIIYRLATGQKSS